MTETIEKTQEENLLYELEQEIRECQKIVLSEDTILFDSHNKVKQAVLLQAYNMNQLIKHYPEAYPYKTCSIFSAIFEEYRRKSVSAKTLDAIREAFRDPEYDIYKINIYKTEKRKLFDEQIQEQGLGEKYSIDTQVFDHIRFIDSAIDHPKIQNWLEQKLKDRNKQETKEKREKEEEDKITIPRPDFIPEDTDGKDSLTYRAALAMTEAWQDITKRIWQFPPEKEDDDKFYSEGIETMHALLVPGTDLKYVRDTLSYLDITYEKETQSIHSAMSKSKILTPSGKYRKVTREQIADISPQMLLLAIHIIERFPGFIKFCLYLIREQKPYSGEFHLNRHPKLSESAFGKSSMMD